MSLLWQNRLYSLPCCLISFMISCSSRVWFLPWFTASTIMKSLPVSLHIISCLPLTEPELMLPSLSRSLNSLSLTNAVDVPSFFTGHLAAMWSLLPLTKRFQTYETSCLLLSLQVFHIQKLFMSSTMYRHTSTEGGAVFLTMLHWSWVISVLMMVSSSQVSIRAMTLALVSLAITASWDVLCRSDLRFRWRKWRPFFGWML